MNSQIGLQKCTPHFKFQTNQLYNKKGFKGLHGEFLIIKNKSMQKLKIYKISKKKFIKVY